MMVQVRELAEELERNLRNFILCERLSEVAKMIKVVAALLLELVDDVYVVLRVKDIKDRFDALLVQLLYKTYLFRKVPEVALLDAQGLEVHALVRSRLLPRLAVVALE